MGELSEKSERFVVCAEQERHRRAQVLFVFFKTKMLFVKGKIHLKPRFVLVKKSEVLSQPACLAL